MRIIYTRSYKNSAVLSVWNVGFLGGSTSKVYLQFRRPGFDPWVRKIPWRRAWQPVECSVFNIFASVDEQRNWMWYLLNLRKSFYLEILLYCTSWEFWCCQICFRDSVHIEHFSFLSVLYSKNKKVSLKKCEIRNSTTSEMSLNI